MKNKKNLFVTGSCGFIGFHLCKYLLEKNYKVYSIDNLNNYYSIKIKKKRLKILKKYKNFIFKKINLNNTDSLYNFVKKSNAHCVIHLAAQPGVRYSFINPNIYLKYNIDGFLKLLKIMENLKINKLIFASSSSVYGDATKFPTNEKSELKPLNFYGSTKMFNEEMAKIFEKNSKINSFGLRFFTAYGSLGRPDMFIDKAIKAIKYNKTISLFNNGNHSRDFTHVYNVVDIIYKLTKKINNFKGYNFFNICSGKKVSVRKLVNLIETKLNKKLKYKKTKKQKGDMLITHGSNKKIIAFLKEKIKFINIDEGLNETLFNDHK